MYVKTISDWRHERPNLTRELRKFAHLLEHEPFSNVKGVRGVSAFALYWFIKRVRPSLVVEVGVWKGYSTWVIEQAAPKARILCLDPIFAFEQLGIIDAKRLGSVYRSSHARYSVDDFSCADLRGLVASHVRTLAFFDDHQNKLARLIQARNVGIRHIVFDDNTSTSSTHRTLEQERTHRTNRLILRRVVRRYEMFPQLWPASGSADRPAVCLDLPLDASIRRLFDERHWYSWVTYVNSR